MNRFSSILCAATLLAASAPPLSAQEAIPAAVTPATGIERKLLERFAVPGTADETVLLVADFAPNANTGRHTHPGTATGYVIYGSIELSADGAPPRLIGAGQSFAVPAGTVHAEQGGPAGARVVAAMTIPTGQPLASPVD